MLARALPSCGGRSALGRHGAPAGCQRVHVLVHAQPQFTSAQAAAAASRPDGADEARKAGAVPIATRPALPCDKPLPLANVMEVQRLLYLLEAPEYVMRAFREHGINGQDLLVLREDDLEDPRFKFPRHVVRKVMRISQAWKVFQSITGSVTKGAITMEQYVAHYSYGRSPDVVTQLQAAYRVVDANSNGSLTFEEFLVGFSLLDAAVADTRRPAFTAGAMHPGMPPSTGQTGVNWFQL